MFKGTLEKSEWVENQLAKIKRGSPAPNSIGYRLELYRFSLGYNGQEMAAHLNVSQGSYSELKNNISSPSCRTIEKIMLLNECDTRWLIIGE